MPEESVATCCLDVLAVCVPRCAHHPCGRAHLAAVITCVSADALYEDATRSRIMPGLMEQLSEGYVDVAVLTGSAQDLAKVSHHRHVTRWCG